MSIRDTRGLFARCLLGDHNKPETQSIGSILLRGHQRAAIARLESAIEEFGGALLSDQAGTGKTYVALALAARCDDATVVAPAVLRGMWRDAASKAAVQISFVSTESLSRSSSPRALRDGAGNQQLVIVDEAQHFRNSATRRFAALSRLCSGRSVLLLSATPIHNQRRDLEVILSLFIGSRAASLSSSELGRVVIRRSREAIADSAQMPDIAKPQWCELSHDDEIPRLLLALPPPLSPRDGGDGGGLVAHSLIRQWISSDAALYHALLRRLQKATALVASLESGVYPSESDLSAWICGEDCVQLGFAELLSPGHPNAERLLPIVREHLSAIQSLAGRIKTSKRRDFERAAIIRNLRRMHDGVGIVAFSHYADTVEGLFDLLCVDGSVAMLAGAGARVVGGAISRADAIGRFAPAASGRKPPRAAEAVTLLLTTDILSEGVNLQDAGVVVHLDLPWTPARMEQRLGRVARMGSRHERVFSYIMKPPASADSLIRTEKILHSKMISARLVTDGLQSMLPGPTAGSDEQNLPALVEELRSILEKWSIKATDSGHADLPASALRAEDDAFLALCRTGGQYRVLCGSARGVTEDPAEVLSRMRKADGDEIGFRQHDLDDSVAAAKRHMQVATSVGSSHSQAHPRQLVQRRALRRIADIANRARPHERSHLMAASSSARATVLGRLSASEESELAALSALHLTDVKWLRAVAALSSARHINPNENEVVAIILFRSDPALER